MARDHNCNLENILVHAVERMFDLREGINRSFQKGRTFEGISLTDRCDECGKQYVLRFQKDRRHKER